MIDPAYREIIELVDIAGFRYAEGSSDILKVPLCSVMSRLSRDRLATLEFVSAENATPIKGSRRRYAG